MASKWSYRSHHSDGSSASHMPTSLGLHVSGEIPSDKTIEDGEDLDRWIEKYMVDNPFKGSPIDEARADLQQMQISGAERNDPRKSSEGQAQLNAGSAPSSTPFAACSMPGTASMSKEVFDLTRGEYPQWNQGQLGSCLPAQCAASHCVMVPVPVVIPVPVPVTVSLSLASSIPVDASPSDERGRQKCVPTSKAYPEPCPEPPAKRRERSRSKAHGQKAANGRAKPHRTEPEDEWQIVPMREQKPPKQLPPASKAVWDTRITKRLEGVDNFKQGEEYKSNQQFCNPRRSSTPNAYDRNLSKRDWEKKIADWRKENRSDYYVRELVEEGFDEDRARAAFATTDEDMAKVNRAAFTKARRILVVQRLVDMGVDETLAEAKISDQDNMQDAMQKLFGN